MVLLEAGLRVGELTQLRIADLWFAGAPVKMLVVRSEIAKRGVERGIPVSVRLDGALRELARVYWRGVVAVPVSPAWYVGQGRRPVGPRQVEALIRRTGLAVLGRPVWPHMLRHTFGTRIEAVAGLKVAQALLGHKDIRTTEIYTHPSADRMLAAVNGQTWNGNGVAK
jgi:integrase